MTNKPLTELYQANAVERYMRDFGGRFVGLTFTKKDGSTRVMNVTKIGDRSGNAIRVFDHNLKEWRMASLHSIKHIKCGKDSKSFSFK